MLQTFTASDELLRVLNELMKVPSLTDFTLVGGTALSFLQGHRMSDDINLFASVEYGTVDFASIEKTSGCLTLRFRLELARAYLT